MKRLTIQGLKSIIKEEANKFSAPVDVDGVKADEVDADEYADTLEKKIDMVSALKIEENRLARRLKKVSETKRRLMRSIKEGARRGKK